MFSLHPFSHLQNESGGWMIPPEHFQVFNAIEVSFSNFLFFFLLGLPNSDRASSSMSPSSVITASKRTSSCLLCITVGEEAVSAQLRVH